MLKSVCYSFSDDKIINRFTSCLIFFSPQFTHHYIIIFSFLLLTAKRTINVGFALVPEIVPTFTVKTFHY